ncbi:MAG TPA: SPOR domain-containing protein [Acidobacteriaceae bacterium]
MSRLLDDDQDLERDRELTLSTGAILAIFLGLVLLCALFFGFGYNLGRKSTSSIPGASVTTPAPEPASSDSSTFNNFKPSPGSPAAAPHNTPSVPTVTVPTSTTATPLPSPIVTTPAPTESTKPHVTPVVPHPAPPAPTHATALATPPAAVPSTTPSAPVAVPNGAFVVQVAAVSRKDDADLLVNALHAKGYQVAARSSPQDKLLHIQVGPFATRKDAEAMRERLIIDGYNAIVK